MSMNRPRGEAQMFWPVFLGIVFLGAAAFLSAWLLIRQGTSETRHRMAGIQKEIEELHVDLQTIETRQAALLSTEAIKQRLAATPNNLREIEPGTVRVIEPERASGVAMGGAPAIDR